MHGSPLERTNGTAFALSNINLSLPAAEHVALLLAHSYKMYEDKLTSHKYFSKLGRELR